MVDKINPNMLHYIEANAKGSDFNTPRKHWDTNSLISILPNHIINKIKAITIPISNLKDRLK